LKKKQSKEDVTETEDEDDPFASIGQQRAISSDGECSDDDTFYGNAKCFENKRFVPDFSKQITPSVTKTANTLGGSSKKEKAKFVIRDGKLVKADSTEADSSSSAPAVSKTPKAKFVIVGGKLVKDDSALQIEKSEGGRAVRRNSLDSKAGDLETEDRMSRRDQLTMLVSSQKTKASKPSFTIVNGKLVKSGEVPSSSEHQSSSKKKKSKEKTEKKSKKKSKKAK
jgi:hypothetical protein